MTRERKTAWVVLIVLAGFLAAVVAHYVMAQYVVRGYPFSTFLYMANDSNQGYIGQPNILGLHRFGDFYEPWITSRDLHAYVQSPLPFPSSYFPVTHLLLYPLAQLPLEVGLVLYLGGFLAVFAVVMYRHAGGDRLSRTQAALVLTVCSTPVLFLVDRANIEGLLFVFLAGSLLAYRRERFYLAAILLAVPVAMKGSAGIFWLLFLFDGRIRALLLSGITFALSSVFALLVLPGSNSANIEGLRSALDTLLTATGQGTAGTRHSVSLKAAFSGLGRMDENFNFFVLHYSWICVAILLGVALVLALLRPVLWQRVALLSAAMILIPSVSFQYRMIHVHLALILFLAMSQRRRTDLLFAVLFGLLLIPKGLPILYIDVNVGTVVNPLLLLILMTAIAVDAVMDRDGRRRVDAVAAWVRRRRGRTSEPAAEAT